MKLGTTQTSRYLRPPVDDLWVPRRNRTWSEAEEKERAEAEARATTASDASDAAAVWLPTEAGFRRKLPTQRQVRADVERDKARPPVPAAKPTNTAASRSGDAPNKGFGPPKIGGKTNAKPSNAKKRAKGKMR